MPARFVGRVAPRYRRRLTGAATAASEFAIRNPVQLLCSNRSPRGQSVTMREALRTPGGGDPAHRARRGSTGGLISPSGSGLGLHISRAINARVPQAIYIPPQRPVPKYAKLPASACCCSRMCCSMRSHLRDSPSFCACSRSSSDRARVSGSAVPPLGGEKRSSCMLGVGCLRR
jgi:hypothetical protein